MGMFKAVVGEPLVQFIVAAMVIFLLLDTAEDSAELDAVRISGAKVEALQDEWLRTWRRPATAQELDGLLNREIAEELYYREGLALGLDRDDAVVRNRLIQKMRFLQDQQLSEPTSQQLEAWLKQNTSLYPDKVLYSFEQLFLGNQIDPIEATKLAGDLNAGELSVEQVGQNLLAPKQMTNVDASEITRSFGRNFSDALSAWEGESLTLNAWVGPVLSGFGLHLVKFEQVQTVKVSLDAAETVQKLTNDWLNAQNEQLEQDYIKRLLERYSVEIERPGEAQ